MVPPWHEEPIAKRHHRDAFDCGDAALNDFLRRYARKSHELGGAKTFLAIDDADRTTILSFYSLSPASVLRATTFSVSLGGCRNDAPSEVNATPAPASRAPSEPCTQTRML